MIIEELIKLDEPKRKTAAVLAVLVVICICYFAITRDSVTKLKAANASYASVQTAHASTENQQTDFLNLQKQLGEKEKRLQEYQRQCFSISQAVQFFENINAIALTYNLKPISRVISEPKNLVDDKVDDENAKPKQQFLKTQSVKVVVSGNYFDIVDFVNELTGRQQKVYITNLHIVLPPGKEVNPKASFSISVLIQVLDIASNEADTSSRNDLTNTITAASSEIVKRVPMPRPKSLRDPMQFGSAASEQDKNEKLIVKGIVYCEDDPSAVIGSQIVHEGDEVTGATVVKISEDSVEFEKNGKRWTQKVQY